jgi:hypothetical protein
MTLVKGWNSYFKAPGNTAAARGDDGRSGGVIRIADEYLGKSKARIEEKSSRQVRTTWPRIESRLLRRRLKFEEDLDGDLKDTFRKGGSLKLEIETARKRILLTLQICRHRF